MHTMRTSLRYCKVYPCACIVRAYTTCVSYTGMCLCACAKALARKCRVHTHATPCHCMEAACHSINESLSISRPCNAFGRLGPNIAIGNPHKGTPVLGNPHGPLYAKPSTNPKIPRYRLGFRTSRYQSLMQGCLCIIGMWSALDYRYMTLRGKDITGSPSGFDSRPQDLIFSCFLLFITPFPILRTHGLGAHGLEDPSHTSLENHSRSVGILGTALFEKDQRCIVMNLHVHPTNYISLYPQPLQSKS